MIERRDRTLKGSVLDLIGGPQTDSGPGPCAVALGRDWYQKAAHCPDSLGDHPDVIKGVGSDGDGVVFYEEVVNAASYAFERLKGGDGDAFYEAWDLYRVSRGIKAGPADLGEDFDFDDAEEVRRRLPRLAALHLGELVG
ncbi:hypothetical protein [Streptomyces sp. V1I1]|uniref:hypothetical protein n=1 Tax=Streptomyces sp. V1I1 TaxID=3042272 RepID=UPI002780D9A8|nr:hypothetical protein [Streptomyces sp. V1I1]MDQ0938361.1 hypothetical protein [Streptomyces sp. V1I1]